MRRQRTLLRLAAAALLVSATSAFLFPLGSSSSRRLHPGSRTQMWSAVTDRPAPTAASSSAASEAVAPVLPGMAEEEADDPNEYFEPEPVDPTIDELKAMNAAEMAHIIPGEGRTVAQWLEQDRPAFSDGSPVADWVAEAQRLRLVPFLERAEHLKALSFDDLNLFRSRQVEWRGLLQGKGLLEAYAGLAEAGITDLSPAEYEAKLSGARESVPPSAVEAEEALLAQVDKLCMGARFEGTAMDGKVKVVMNGRMEPQGVTVQDGALGDAKVLGAAVEAAADAAYKQAAEFYEEVMATEYLAKASTPTDVQGIVEMLGSREFALEEDVVDSNML